MNLGFVGGSGNLGFGMAVRLAKAGHSIFIGSRNAEKGMEGANRLLELLPNAKVCGGTNKEACEAAEVVFLSIPFEAQNTTLPDLAAELEGKIVVDVTVPMRYGKPPVYITPEAGSAGQNVARLLPNSIVVSGFHTVSAASLADPDRELDCDALVCGDDEEAKKNVMELCNFLPRIINAGAITNAQSIERLTPLLINLNQLYKRRHIGVRFTGI